MNNPFVLKFHDILGDDSVVKAEIANWNGLVVKFARDKISSIAEMERTGAYILIGGDPLNPTVYVGEGDPIKDRMVRHNLNKKFWEYAIIFVSKDDTTLNKAHVQYLEYRMVQLAQKNKKCILDNGNTPAAPTLDGFHKQEAEDFLSYILKVLVKFNVWCFYESPIIPINTTKITNGVNIVSLTPVIKNLNSKGISANGETTGTGITVKKGSMVYPKTVPSCPKAIINLRNILLSNGTIKDDNGSLTFDNDYVFSSLSQAACVILGMSVNGVQLWK